MILFCFAKIDIFLKPNKQLSNYKFYHFREFTKMMDHIDFIHRKMR